jgi:hypothetical protein
MNLRNFRGTVWSALALVVGLAATGCGDDRFIVVGTATAASTSGFVEVQDSDDDGADLLVHMEQLHPVQHVDPAAKFYVVWLDSGNGAAKLAGALSYDADKRVGELKTRSSSLKFIVKITAEKIDAPSTPSEVIVATQEISIDD